MQIQLDPCRACSRPALNQPQERWRGGGPVSCIEHKCAKPNSDSRSRVTAESALPQALCKCNWTHVKRCSRPAPNQPQERLERWRQRVRHGKLAGQSTGKQMQPDPCQMVSKANAVPTATASGRAKATRETWRTSRSKHRKAQSE